MPFGRCLRKETHDDKHGCTCAVEAQFEYFKTTCRFWQVRFAVYRKEDGAVLRHGECLGKDLASQPKTSSEAAIVIPPGIDPSRFVIVGGALTTPTTKRS